jgi:hypothetical protein
MAMQSAVTTEVVNDPVSHISISGVHGRDELNDRLAHVKTHRETGRPVALALSAVAGAAIMYLLTR